MLSHFLAKQVSFIILINVSNVKNLKVSIQLNLKLLFVRKQIQILFRQIQQVRSHYSQVIGGQIIEANLSINVQDRKIYVSEVGNQEMNHVIQVILELYVKSVIYITSKEMANIIKIKIANVFFAVILDFQYSYHFYLDHCINFHYFFQNHRFNDINCKQCKHYF